MDTIVSHLTKSLLKKLFELIHTVNNNLDRFLPIMRISYKI